MAFKIKWYFTLLQIIILPRERFKEKIFLTFTVNVHKRSSLARSVGVCVCIHVYMHCMFDCICVCEIEISNLMPKQFECISWFQCCHAACFLSAAND